MHVWSCTKIFPHGKKRIDFHISSFSKESSCSTPCVHPQACGSLRSMATGLQNCWTLRHGQAYIYFLPVSRKQNPVHVHTEILSRPGCAATSMSLSSISPRVKLTSMMAGDKNCNFSLCKTSRIGTFLKVVHNVSSFQNKKPKQTVKPSQYRLEINLKCLRNFDV